MKIATWNLERPRASSSKKDPKKILEALKEINADVVILTETHSMIHLGNEYQSFPSDSLFASVGSYYRDGENRTTIWSKYPKTREIKTFDSATSVCVGLKTFQGELIVYGTVIGVLGNRRPSFARDLEKQIADWRAIKSENVCIAGDFNISFADNYYYTKQGRCQLDDTFATLKLRNLTRSEPENIDHIVVSESFVRNAKCERRVWNRDKKLSDHIGVSVNLIYS